MLKHTAETVRSASLLVQKKIKCVLFRCFVTKKTCFKNIYFLNKLSSLAKHPIVAQISHKAIHLILLFIFYFYLFITPKGSDKCKQNTQSKHTKVQYGNRTKQTHSRYEQSLKKTSRQQTWPVCRSECIPEAYWLATAIKRLMTAFADLDASVPSIKVPVTKSQRQ